MLIHEGCRKYYILGFSVCGSTQLLHEPLTQSSGSKRGLINRVVKGDFTGSLDGRPCGVLSQLWSHAPWVSLQWKAAGAGKPGQPPSQPLPHQQSLGRGGVQHLYVHLPAGGWARPHDLHASVLSPVLGKVSQVCVASQFFSKVADLCAIGNRLRRMLQYKEHCYEGCTLQMEQGAGIVCW